MSYPEQPPLAIIAALLVLVPLPRQLRAGNIACIALIFWFFQHCVVMAVNGIIWAGNVNDSAPIWCDITNRLRDAANMGLPAATFCICKHLEYISSKRPVVLDKRQTRRKIFEVIMCFGIPLLWIPLFYFFQTARYMIIEDLGCYSAFIRSAVSTVVLLVPSLLLAVATLCYGCTAIFHLLNNRRVNMKILSPHLASRDSALSGRQYYRLMAMSMIVGLWGVVWIAVEIHLSVTPTLPPLPSWKVIHEDDDVVIELPAIVLGKKKRSNERLIWWAVPGAAYLFFVLFGTSYDVLSEYQRFWIWFQTVVLKRPPQPKSATSSTIRSGTVPRFKNTSIHIDTTVVIDDLESKMPKSASQSIDTPIGSPK